MANLKKALARKEKLMMSEILRIKENVDCIYYLVLLLSETFLRVCDFQTIYEKVKNYMIYLLQSKDIYL